MSDSVSDKESSFKFLDDSYVSELEQAGAEELEQVARGETATDDIEDQVVKSAQTVAHKVNTAPARVVASAKIPPSAIYEISNFKVNVAGIIILILACSMLFIVFNAFIERINRHHDLRTSKISERLHVDQIIKEVIDRADRKDNFKKIKCLEDIPEELMNHWTPDESKFEGLKETESFKTVNQIFREGRPVFTKIYKGLMIYQLVDNKKWNSLLVDNLNKFWMSGTCTFTMYAQKGDFGQVFVKEGLLYIILGSQFEQEEEKIKLVYSMPEEYL